MTKKEKKQLGRNKFVNSIIATGRKFTDIHGTSYFQEYVDKVVLDKDNNEVSIKVPGTIVREVYHG